MGSVPSTMNAEAPLAPLLLYDGECALCDRAVQFVLSRDRKKTLRFAALQGETARPILARHGLTPPTGMGFDSMVFVDDPGSPRERISLRSRAALRIGRYLGGRWSALARLGGLLPAILGDGAYRLVARTRHRLFPPPEACRVPAPEERARFLP